jgi:hypothetical protein
MIFHLHACLHIPDQPEDQPISARRRGVNKAEPKEIAIPQQ